MELKMFTRTRRKQISETESDGGLTSRKTEMNFRNSLGKFTECSNIFVKTKTLKPAACERCTNYQEEKLTWEKFQKDENEKKTV